MFIVSFLVSEQISPEDWAVSTKMKKFEENATLKEVKEWVMRSVRQDPQNRMIEIKINEPE